MHPLMRRIDGYCERMSEAFWAEPANAVSNLAFILAALGGLWLARRMDRLDGPVLFLVVNAFVVGVGSFLFHTFATVWAAIADTGPILIFILAYFTIAMNRYLGFGWGRSILLTIGFLIAMGATSALFRELLHPIVGGSQAYFPALLALFGIGAWIARQGNPAGKALMAAAGIFAVSLAFRTADQPVCSDWPVGTHFMWHLLNGLLLFVLIRALVLHGRRPVPATAAA